VVKCDGVLGSATFQLILNQVDHVIQGVGSPGACVVLILSMFNDLRPRFSGSSQGAAGKAEGGSGVAGCGAAPWPAAIRTSVHVRQQRSVLVYAFFETNTQTT
jgi:hypothetical protein